MNSPLISATFVFAHSPMLDRRVHDTEHNTRITVIAGDESELQKLARARFHEHFGISRIISVRVIERREVPRQPMTAMEALFAKVDAVAQRRGAA